MGRHKRQVPDSNDGPTASAPAGRHHLHAGSEVNKHSAGKVAKARQWEELPACGIAAEADDDASKVRIEVGLPHYLPRPPRHLQTKTQPAKVI